MQGYEPFGMKYLLTRYNESDIKYKKSDMPKIMYCDNKKDIILISSLKLII